MRRIGAKEFLESRGVTFPEGAGASYNPVVNMLTVRNTAKNINTVDTLVEQALKISRWHQVGFGAVVVEHGHGFVVGLRQDAGVVALELCDADAVFAEDGVHEAAFEFKRHFI